MDPDEEQIKRENEESLGRGREHQKRDAVELEIRKMQRIRRQQREKEAQQSD